MKKSLKRILAVALAMVFVLGTFAACGKSEPAKTFKIGAIGPLTGGAAVYGKAVQNGAQLAVDEINKAGGINGMQVEFKMEDDEHNPATSVNAYNNLLGWGMKALVGTVTTGPCLAVIKETKASNMFQLTPSASAPDVVVNDNCFQVCFSDTTQGIRAADYIADAKIATKIAVIYNSSDEYSTGIYNSFVTEAKAKGLSIVAEEAFTADSSTDFSAQLNKTKSAGAELVFIPIYADVASSLLTQASKMSSFNPIFFGCDGLDGLLNIDGFDTKIAENVLLLTPFAPNEKSEATEKFVKAFRDAKYDESTLNQFAADAYDAVYIIKKAAEEGKVTLDMDVSATCDALKAAMTKIEVDGVTGDNMKWKETGEVNKSAKIYKIVNGEYQIMN